MDTAHDTGGGLGEGPVDTSKRARPKEVRQRVLISTQYERKIDQFEARLAGIEGMLRELTLSINGRNASTSAPPTTNGSPAGPTSRTQTTASPVINEGIGHEESNAFSEADSAFEGDSSMAAHSVFASKFLHEAVTRTSFRMHNPEMESALQSLQQIAALQNRENTHDSRFEHVKPIPKGGFRELPMPPMQTVASLLRGLKGKYSLLVVTSPTDFTEWCRMVYFADEDYSLTIFALVNGGLYYIMQERAAFAEGEEQAEMLRWMEMCRDNFETAMANLPLLMPARRESIQVLVLASTYTIEQAKYTLAWRFNLTAVILCQTLGYHRQPTPEAAAADPASDLKAAFFWFTYANDKCFSLRFGRSSMIQDSDITVSRRLGDGIVFSHPVWRTVFHQWINHAEFIGKAYEQLYSPAALAHTPERRAESARGLIRMLEAINRNMHAEREAAGVTWPVEGREASQSPYSIEMSTVTDDLMFYVAMTLIYRAIPNDPGAESSLYGACLEAARKAIACHHQCMALAENEYVKAGYIHWSILYLPFVPVIVLFCHVIETSNLDDLQLLSDFADSLQPVCSVSKATEKLLRICRVLCGVARLYTEAKAQQDQNSNLVENDIDMYLSQLGFIPQQYHPTPEGTSYEDGIEGFDASQGMRLGNWYSANRHLLGLVEGDFPGVVEPRAWSSIAGPP
ncbi:hypothetical protein B0T16DRAFT_450919 [Cercophora newfieldiana]|uniref:Xylanolytic transcriptional activator regulatory domain-containing protein n=1 Tax=Cercophora newfieldiana TaxID=92897 RepID=A0AA40CZW3_9PEZI|nr:hypothetical protein B0T16DRAFT_450919 [Cercophora newfieldiana]